MNAEELKKDILEKTAEYYRLVHAPKQSAEFVPGKSRVNYAGRVFDEKEMTNLVDSALEFWLTAGRYTAEFEKKFAEYLGVKFDEIDYNQPAGVRYKSENPFPRV